MTEEINITPVKFSKNNQFWTDEKELISVSVETIGEICAKPMIREIWNWVSGVVKNKLAEHEDRNKFVSLQACINLEGKIYIEFYDKDGNETVVETDLSVDCTIHLYDGDTEIE